MSGLTVVHGNVALMGTAGNLAEVTASGEIKVVTPPPTTPVGGIRVEQIEYDEVSGTDVSDYVIPENTCLTIQRFISGCASSTEGSVAELWLDNNGNGLDMEVIDAHHIKGSHELSVLERTITGDGTKVIKMRRKRLDGGGKNILAKWEGYLELKPYTVLEEGVSDSVGYDWLDRDTNNPVWGVGDLQNKFVLIDGLVLRKIDWNSTDVLWFSDGNDITGIGIPYKIIEFTS